MLVRITRKVQTTELEATAMIICLSEENFVCIFTDYVSAEHFSGATYFVMLVRSRPLRVLQ